MGRDTERDEGTDRSTRRSTRKRTLWSLTIRERAERFRANRQINFDTILTAPKCVCFPLGAGGNFPFVVVPASEGPSFGSGPSTHTQRTLLTGGVILGYTLDMVLVHRFVSDFPFRLFVQTDDHLTVDRRPVVRVVRKQIVHNRRSPSVILVRYCFQPLLDLPSKKHGCLLLGLVVFTFPPFRSDRRRWEVKKNGAGQGIYTPV